jgi:hypothetical protein
VTVTNPVTPVTNVTHSVTETQQPETSPHTAKKTNPSTTRQTFTLQPSTLSTLVTNTETSETKTNPVTKKTISTIKPIPSSSRYL